ncbi:MAG: integral rane sensor signal transduction histidine kinase [Thermoleophilia bacterium]|nr:integral rane sensor signal transduction histidine kinase [Thermoleophilia bacterium]
MTLRTRLALALLLAVGAGVLVFSVVARATVEQLLYADVDRDLRAEVRRTIDNLDRTGSVGPGGRGDVRGGRGRPPLGRRGPGEFFGRDALFAQVLDSDGDVVLQTTGVDALGGLPDTRLEPEDAGEPPRLRSVAIDGDRFRMAEAVTRDGSVVQLARPLSELAGFLDTLVWVLLAAGGVALGAAVLLGRWAARATLRPVGAMTRTAQSIARSPRNLSTRVEPAFADPELREFADAMNEMLGSIETADLHQRRFVADASHELRTPLTSLGGNATFLDRVATLDDDARDALDAVRRDIERLTRIADGLTTLARLDSVPEVHLEPIDVDAVVREAVARSRDLYPTHDFTITGRGDTQLLDSELARRIVGNLLDNAGRYTPTGSSVTVTLGGGSIVVEDDGPGLDGEDLARARERFHRGSTSAGVAGTGLGLAIVDDAARAMGGTLELGAVAPHGLRCTVRLPGRSGADAAG